MAIPTPIIRTLEDSGILRTMAIDLSENPEDRAAIIEVLRSRIYANKILAPIREYSTNGADSHVEAGCPETPLHVVLPTPIMPELRIRDFGIGLSPDDVERIYIKYGRSTKRNTNTQTGQLGLGCKSAFAYGDNFIVISYKDGVKTTYNLTINGTCSVLTAEPMIAEEKNGVEVVIPVHQGDVSDFQSEAIEFFKYWKVCPEIVGGDVERLQSLREELAQKPLFAKEDWEIRPHRGYGSERGVAVMGNVPYPINWDLLTSKMGYRYGDNNTTLYNFVRSNKTILRFNIGDLDFSASRESLEYTEKTCQAIVNKVNEIVDSIFEILQSKIAEAPTYFDALLVYNQIFGKDDERLFSGDVHRLEGYYKGKFSWKDIKIESGNFDHIDRFDISLGYSETGTWKVGDSQITSHGSNPVLTVFENRNRRVRELKGYDYSGHRRIPASKKTCILIHDLEKPVLTKASVRWMMFESDPSNKPSKVYLLRFKDVAQRKQFFEVMHFESVPVTYVSTIVDKVKAWLKSSRISSGGSSGVRDPQTVRFFNPANRLSGSGYWQNVEFDRTVIDIKEEEGYYVDLFEGQAMLNGNVVGNLAALSHYTYVLLNALGETPSPVYALPERNRNAKWFGEATKEGQWTKIEDYLKENEEAILYGKGALAAKAAKYYNCDEDFHIGINFATGILPLLTNKEGAMYKACSEISEDFRKMMDLINALKFFGMAEKLTDDCKTGFDTLFVNVKNSYPMISIVENSRYIFSSEKTTAVPSEWLKKIADYVNMVDKANVSSAI